MNFQRIIKAAIAVASKPHCNESKDWRKDALNELENIQFSPEYAEPGYSQPERGILLADWNRLPERIERPNKDRKNLSTILESAGYEIEWSDEWSDCSECGKLVRTSPDSYGWTASYAIMNECELLCINCLKKNAEEYLLSIENHPKQACISDIDPTDYGYILLKDNFENGFHPGQNDNPQTIYKELQDEKESRHLVFHIDSKGQFDLSFSIYERIALER